MFWSAFTSHQDFLILALARTSIAEVGQEHPKMTAGSRGPCILFSRAARQEERTGWAPSGRAEGLTYGCSSTKLVAL